MRLATCLKAFIAAATVFVSIAETTHANPQAKKPRILCITVTAGFRHSKAIDTSKKVLPEMAAKSGAFDIEFSETTEKITGDGLAGFDAVFFNNTTGDLGKFPLDEAGRDALIRFVKEGGSFIGTHAATDTFKDWEAYWEMIGG